MKETVNCLDGVLIKPGRRVGNTTRITDNAIQLLFSGNIVVVNDHYGNRQADEYLAKEILRRLSQSHDLHGKENVRIDLTKTIITIDLLVVDEKGNYIRK